MGDPAQQFRDMAERIEHNQGKGFAGAAVIVPPSNGGDPVELLILDASGDPAQFWSTVMTRAKMIVEALDQKNRMQQGFR